MQHLFKDLPHGQHRAELQLRDLGISQQNKENKWPGGQAMAPWHRHDLCGSPELVTSSTRGDRAPEVVPVFGNYSPCIHFPLPVAVQTRKPELRGAEGFACDHPLSGRLQSRPPSKFHRKRNHRRTSLRVPQRPAPLQRGPGGRRLSLRNQ